MDTPVAARAPADQQKPAVAANGGTFLVVWEDSRNFATTEVDIYGARISTGGSVLDAGGIPVSRGADDQLAPAIASSGADYLAVWQDTRNLGSTDYDIYGARVTSGGVVSDASGFAIGVAANAQSLPAVAANGQNLLVVWQDARGGGLEVYGARVVGAGVLDPLGLAIDTGVLGRQLPALASGSSGAFLVVNQAVRNGADRIVGNLVRIGDAPLITSITRAAGAATLIWTSISGRTYRVQNRASLTDPAWLDLSGAVTQELIIRRRPIIAGHQAVHNRTRRMGSICRGSRGIQPLTGQASSTSIQLRSVAWATRRSSSTPFWIGREKTQTTQNSE